MQEAYLEMVTSSNNNKYYHMTQTSADTFEVRYGRIGASAQKASYAMSQWDRKYKEKIRKGYKDTTHLQAKIEPSNSQEEYMPIPDQDIAALVEYLRKKASETIKANYRIAANAVSAGMIREAQRFIDELMTARTKQEFNETLLELFTALPRKMNNVPNYLLDTDSDEARRKIIAREQRLLDVMSSQAAVFASSCSNNNAPQNNTTVLEAFGLKIEPADGKDIQLIKKELGESASHFYKAWRVTNEETEAAFQAHIKHNKITKRKRRLFWHGSRTENWWGILKTGLRLRPTNVAVNGKMFGMGTYFAPKARKSIGYTSMKGSYWVGGGSQFGFLALFDTAYGKPWFPDSYSEDYKTLNYEKLQKLCPGADCLHAKAGIRYMYTAALRNDEIIFYKEDQMTIRYLVELKA